VSRVDRHVKQAARHKVTLKEGMNMKVVVTLPPDYPRNDPNYPSKERLEMAYTALLPAMIRILTQKQKGKKQANSA
jgi:hypothetical protein